MRNSIEEIRTVKEIVERYPQNQWESIARERKMPFLWYHLSQQREGLLGWLPIRREDEVLDWHSECGASVQGIAEQSRMLVSVEAEENMREIQSIRFDQNENIHVVSNVEFKSGYHGHVFDWVIVNHDISVLSQLSQYLKEKGTLVLNVHNKMALSHWNGNPYETGTLFDGLQNGQDNEAVYGYTKKDIEIKLREIGMNQVEFYYPYPDAICPMHIFSDEIKISEDKAMEYNSVFSNRVRLFDEKKVMEMLIKEELYEGFFENYIVVARRKI